MVQAPLIICGLIVSSGQAQSRNGSNGFVITVWDSPSGLIGHYSDSQWAAELERIEVSDHEMRFGQFTTTGKYPFTQQFTWAFHSQPNGYWDGEITDAAGTKRCCRAYVQLLSLEFLDQIA